MRTVSTTVFLVERLPEYTSSQKNKSVAKRSRRDVDADHNIGAEQ